MRKEEDSSCPSVGAFDPFFDSLADALDLLFFFLDFPFFLSPAFDVALLGVVDRFFLLVLTLLHTDLADVSTSEDIIEAWSPSLVAVFNSEML